MNRVFLIGHVGARPEIRTTGSGMRVATFSVATGHRATRGAPEKTEWHRIVAWDRLAETVAKSVNRGDRVFVEGRLEYRSYEDSGGRTRHMTEVVADDLITFEGRAGGAEGTNPWKERVVS